MPVPATFSALSLDGSASLTTIFTPDPECVSPLLVGGYSPSYWAVAFLNSVCTGFHTTVTRNCFPESSAYLGTPSLGSVPVLTYLPGIFCPSGMTTATSYSWLDAVICCPSGLSYHEDYATCLRTATGGTFLHGDCSASVSTTVVGSDVTLKIYAPTVFLGGQHQYLSRFPLSTPTSSPTTQTTEPSSYRTRQRTIKIGAGVGGTIAVLLTAALAFLCITRYRRKRLKPSSSAIDRCSAYTGKPELEGSEGQPGGEVYISKTELDAIPVRFELEGTQQQENGMGIYVQKPELVGSLVTESLAGIYVKTKAEMDGGSDGLGMNERLPLPLPKFIGAGDCLDGAMQARLQSGDSSESLRATCPGPLTEPIFTSVASMGAT
ncbi:hypothetical protein F5Y15DRAFT_385070 [Xylariaceae sp. FL0016]|nr:hypothetical protein F5Y15DRAFT_385070 [Xylariaceae sp. FL0016]